MLFVTRRESRSTQADSRTLIAVPTALNTGWQLRAAHSKYAIASEVCITESQIPKPDETA